MSASVVVFLMYCSFLLFPTGEDIAKEVENNERIKNQLGSKSKPVCASSFFLRWSVELMHVNPMIFLSKSTQSYKLIFLLFFCRQSSSQKNTQLRKLNRCTPITVSYHPPLTHASLSHQLNQERSNYTPEAKKAALLKNNLYKRRQTAGPTPL